MMQYCSTCGKAFEQSIQEFVVICGKVSIPRVKLPVLICSQCQSGIVQVGLYIEENTVTIQNVVLD